MPWTEVSRNTLKQNWTLFCSHLFSAFCCFEILNFVNVIHVLFITFSCVPFDVVLPESELKIGCLNCSKETTVKVSLVILETAIKWYLDMYLLKHLRS